MEDTLKEQISAQAKATGAHRVTMEDIDDEIAAVHYFTAAEGVQGGRTAAGLAPSDPPIAPALALLTICVLVLHNGYTVTGKSACADPAMFNADIGRKVALNDAKGQCWALLGFRLRDRITAAHAHGIGSGNYTNQPLGNPHGL